MKQLIMVMDLCNLVCHISECVIASEFNRVIEKVTANDSKSTFRKTLKRYQRRFVENEIGSVLYQ